MTWQGTLSRRLRYYIHDISSTPTYTDIQLSQFIAIAAIYVANDVNLGVTFSIDTDVPSISPDPVLDTSLDAAIGNLFVAKAACIIIIGEARRDISKYGIKIKDHLTSYDGTKGADARKESTKDFCNRYDEAIKEWQIGNIANVGRAIFGPYRSFNHPFNHNDPGYLEFEGNDANGGR